MSARIFLVAAEPSGDLLGREVAEALRALNSNIELAGIGGTEMASVGLTTDIDTSPLSVVGLFEGLRAYPKVVELADAATEQIIAFKPDKVVLIDSWGFMLRVAQRLKKRAPSIHLVKLIGPQVWATRAGRAKTLAATVDQLLAMFEMEVPYYREHGLPAKVIGNPALARTKMGDGGAFRTRHNISETGKVLLVLPGSRRGEIKRVAPALVEAAQKVKQQMEGVTLVFAPAESVAQQFSDAFPDIQNSAIVTSDPAQRLDVMAAADLSLACSGTVTSELAMQGTPFLVAYKLGWITWAIARGFLYKPDYMNLLNIAAGKEIAQEFFQTKLKAEDLANAAVRLLRDPAALRAQKLEQDEAMAKMGVGGPSAALLAAEAILSNSQVGT